MVTLVYMDADGIERSFMLGPEPVTIGRSPECGIRSNDPLVSRNHARLYLDQVGTVCIEDLGSANGVYVGQHKVSAAAVPAGEIILVGSLRFRQVPANIAPQPEYAAPPRPEHAAPQPYGAPQAEYAAPQAPAMQPSPYAMPPAALQQPPAMQPPPAMPPAMPPPAGQAGADGHGALAHLLEVERQGRLSAEQERDAYGARMSELHKELRTLKDAYGLLQQQESTSQANIEELKKKPVVDPATAKELRALKEAYAQLQQQESTAQASIAELKKKPVLDPATAEGRAAALAEELEHARFKVDDSDDRVKAAEARLQSAEEELTVARADLLASEERLMSEMSAMEQRTSAELSMRVDELNVARADLTAAEDRILNLSRTISELEQRLARHGILPD